MNRSARIAITVLFASAAVSASAQMAVKTDMDWPHGRIGITASRMLDEGMSPSDHPRALTALEMELPPYIFEVISSLSWDDRGTIGDLIARDPAARTPVEELARSFKREWSRLSANRDAVEAAYTLDLAEVFGYLSPAPFPGKTADIPIAWTPVPEDDWSGIIIYAPPDLPVRGTQLKANPVPALGARILSNRLEVLADPAVRSGKLLSYRLLEEKNDTETLVGRRPYHTMARGLYGDFPCDIILSADDSRRIMASESGRAALASGRIVILLDAIPE